MKKIIVLTLFLLPFWICANAQVFAEDYWKYEVISNVDLTVKLVGRSNNNSPHWQSLTEIPSSVIHNGISFTVTKIGKKATHWESYYDNGTGGYYRTDYHYGIMGHKTKSTM